MATVLEDAKGLANRLVIRLCVRLAEPNKLSEFIFASAMAFTLIGAGFCVMQQLEKLHPRVISEHDVSFELNLPTVPKKPQPVRTRTKARIAAAEKPTRTNMVAAMRENASSKKAVVAAIRPALIASPDAANASPMPQLSSDPNSANAAMTEGQSGASAGPAVDTDSPGTAPLKPQGDLNAVAGADFGAQRPLALAVAAPRMGNIKPYKQDLLQKLAKHWHPHKGYDKMILSVTLNKEGKVVNTEVVESSGSERADHDALETINSIEFSALPDWYKGEHLTCKLNLATVFGEK